MCNKNKNMITQTWYNNFDNDYAAPFGFIKTTLSFFFFPRAFAQQSLKLRKIINFSRVRPAWKSTTPPSGARPPYWETMLYIARARPIVHDARGNVYDDNNTIIITIIIFITSAFYTLLMYTRRVFQTSSHRVKTASVITLSYHTSRLSLYHNI